MGIDEIIELQVKDVNTDEEIEQQYTVELLEWGSKSMEMKVKFKNNLEISRNVNN